MMQQQTLLGPNTKFKGVPLVSGSDNIAFVEIERGSKASPTDSATGVALTPLSPGSGYLVVDDLSYEPPSSPPESSFLLGASPSTARFAPGAKSPQIKIPVTWTANPNPSASPVSMELTRPRASPAASPPIPTGSGQSILVLEAKSRSNRGQVHGDDRRRCRKRRGIGIALERSDPGRNQRTVQARSARQIPGLPPHPG